MALESCFLLRTDFITDFIFQKNTKEYSVKTWTNVGQTGVTKIGIKLICQKKKKKRQLSVILWLNKNHILVHMRQFYIEKKCTLCFKNLNCNVCGDLPLMDSD